MKVMMMVMEKEKRTPFIVVMGSVNQADLEHHVPDMEHEMEQLSFRH